MSGVRSVICAILICTAYPSAAGILYTKVRILLSGYVLSSPGEAYLYDGTNYPGSGSAYRITGHHRIASDSYAIVKDVEFSTTGSYNIMSIRRRMVPIGAADVIREVEQGR